VCFPGVEGAREPHRKNHGRSIHGFQVFRLSTKKNHPWSGAVMDSHKRSLIKSLSYRLFGTGVTRVGAWLVTGELGDAVAVGVGDSAAKFFFFYLHERMWTRIEYGRLEPPDYQI
jgi:uncharacterized membrane protein